MGLFIKKALPIICLWVVSYTNYGQEVRTIDNKGTINKVDGSNDAFKNNTTTSSVELATQSDDTTTRSPGTEFVILDNGSLGISIAIPKATLHNNGSTIDTYRVFTNIATGGNIATAAASIDIGSTFAISQSSPTQILSLPNPTDTTAGRLVKVANIGNTDFIMYGIKITPNTFVEYLWNGTNWMSTAIPEFNTLKHAEFVPTTDFDVNTITQTPKNFFSSSISNDGAVTKTSDALITIDQSGLYQINFNCLITHSNGNTRRSPQATIFINGTAARVTAATGYIRQHNTGNDFSSWNISYIIRLADTDTIEIRTIRDINGGIVSIVSSSTSFTITKIGI